MRLAWAMVFLAGCGRLSFEPRSDGASDTAPDRPNRVFVTSFNQPGGFGGIAAADAVCANEAAAAGLPGTFIAFLASSAMQTPRSRLAGSRGWTLVDGTPVGTTVEAMLDDFAVFNPIDTQADGTRIATNAQATWTGTSQLGDFDTNGNCLDWTDSGSLAMGQGNNVRNATWSGGSVVTCDTARRLLCFEIGHDADVAPVATTGRLVFLTIGKRTSALTVTDADMMCATEAASAALPGTYRAALTTTTESLASRFTIDSRPFIRRDGTLVAAADEFLTNTTRTSFAHQLSDGSYTKESFWTGVGMNPTVTATSAQTCNDWMNAGTGTTGQAGQTSHTIASQFWSAYSHTCDTRNHFLCVQQ